MKKIIIVILILIFTILLYPNISQLRNNGKKLGYNALKKEYDLLKKHPEYRNFMFRPSKRQLINNAKAGTDTIHVLVLKVEFLEDSSTLTTGNGKMDLRGSTDEEFYVDEETGDTLRNLYYQVPHDSLYFYRQMEAMQNYYLDDSHGKLYVDFDIYPKGLYNTYTVPHTMLYYGDTTDIVRGLFTLLRDALIQAEFAGDVDFDKFDAVIVFHAGSMWQTDMLYDSPFDLPAVYITGADEVFGQPIHVGNKDFYDGIIYSETANQDGGYAFIQGGLAHEFGHQLGLFDLYDTYGMTMGMGGWALMGTGNWNMSGLVPPHHAGYNACFAYNSSPNNTYSNFVYFNQTYEIINDTTNVKIKYLGANEDSTTKIYKIPINAHEYYLIENRYVYMNPDTISDNPDSNGFRVWKDGVLVKVDDYDISLPPDVYSGGIAIYHIDETMIDSFRDWNEVNAHTPKGVDMEEADMVQDFETSFYDITDIEKVFFGSPYDLFFKGGVNDKFGESTIPNTRANNGGNSHIWIYSISPPDTVMTFSVKFNYKLNNFPFTLNTMPDVNAPNIININGEKIIFLQTMNGEIYAINSNGEGAFNSTGIVATLNSQDESYSTITAGYISNKNTKDLVVTSYSGYVNILRTDSITVFGNFIPENNSPFIADKPIVSSALLYDIDNDSLDEILFTSEDMYLHILEYDSLQGIIEKDFSPIFLGAESWSMPIIVDSTIYILSSDGVIHAYDFNGNEKFKSNTENIIFTTSSPIINDIDGDNENEIIFIRGDGSVVSVNAITGKTEFEKLLPEYPFYSSPVCGDVNNDGKNEIILFVYNKLYVLDYNGNIINDYPININNEDYIQSSPILADINDDNVLDILYVSSDGKLNAISNAVTPGFPFNLGQFSNSTPIVGDINNNGKLDIIATGDNMMYVYELSSSINEKNWPLYHYSENNNRFYPFASNANSSTDTLLLKNDNNNYIYPNPVYDIFTLRFNTDIAEKYNISIFDISGQMKMQFENINAHAGINEYQINARELAAGFYILRLEIFSNNQSIVKMYKFVVRK